MATNHVQPGRTVTVTAPYDVASGAGVLVGKLFGVAQYSALSGAEVEIDTVEVWRLPKVLAQAWTQGALVYWDDTAKLVTTTVSTNVLIGHALLAAANPTDIGTVRLSN